MYQNVNRNEILACLDEHIIIIIIIIEVIEERHWKIFNIF